MPLWRAGDLQNGIAGGSVLKGGGGPGRTNERTNGALWEKAADSDAVD